MNYKDAGVNIDAGNEAVELIKPIVKQTLTPNVLGGLGSFAGFYELPEGYKRPVLVSCTDGVGTKLKLAIHENKFDTVGIDLVAMCVNDLICCGAKPLFFLDYIACHQLVPSQMKDVLSGMATACTPIGVSIVGGEMAEMSDMYSPGDLDLAGFCVGVVEKSEIIDSQKVSKGNFVYGLPSSGVHSNGYTLVRKVFSQPEDLAVQGISMSDLLEPTRIYVNEVLSFLSTHPITGIAHITGGGLAENIERSLPKGLGLKIEKSSLPILPIFTAIQNQGNISDQEMFRVFNMGIGMVLISETEIDDDSLIYLGKIDSSDNGVVINGLT